MLGDDSVFLYVDELDSSSISDAVSELGLESNPSKQHISTTSVHYLQRLHSINFEEDGLYKGMRSVYRTLSGMLSYERFRNNWSKWMDSCRWIMQLENAKNNPNFSNLVTFTKEGDDVLNSGIPVKEIFSRAGGSMAIKSTLGISSYPFNSMDPSGIATFETTKLLDSMS
uniref:RdRp n=1 Tax=viral metagenome TaxID=1070528 RepID=A0A2V0RA06_9ZZZZ